MPPVEDDSSGRRAAKDDSSGRRAAKDDSSGGRAANESLRTETRSEHKQKKDNDATFYEDVSLGSSVGRVRVTNDDLCFKAKDGSRKVKLQWDQLSKTMISPSTSDPMLKLVSKNNNAKVLHFPKRGSLVSIQEDIRRRRSTGRRHSFGSSSVHGTQSHSETRSKTKKLRKTKSHAAGEHHHHKHKPDYNWAKHSFHGFEKKKSGGVPDLEAMPGEAKEKSPKKEKKKDDLSALSSHSLDSLHSLHDDDDPNNSKGASFNASLSYPFTPSGKDDDDPNNSKGASFNASLSYPFTPSGKMNEAELQRQVNMAMEQSLSNLSPDATDEEKAKVTRVTRRSLLLSTRVDALNQSKQMNNMSMSGNSLKGSTRMSISRRGTNSFVMLKDLEERDEFHKIQLGAFLRELYKLAEQETKDQLKETLRMSSSTQGGGSRRRNEEESIINFEGTDLASMTPAQAKTKIDALHAGGKIDGDSLISLIKAGVEVLGQEDTVIDLRKHHPKLTKVTAVGDLHGSLECLMKVLKLADMDSTRTNGDGQVIVFDGDFVDRGYNSLEVIATLLMLKIASPNNVFLLRGNHEDSMVATSYGFRDEVDEKYGYEKGDELWWEFGLLFAAFPICARSNTAVIMHGGIPVEEFDLNDFNELKPETRCEMKTVSDPYDDDERLLQGVLWSDPSEEEGINFSDRGAGFTFGPDISADFLARHDLKYIIRAHEVVETGYCQHDVGDGQGVITIFSSANYPAGEGTNHGAVLFLDDKSGAYETKDFIHKDDDGSQETKLLRTILGTFVDGHKSQLTKAFRAQQNDNDCVTCQQWADIIAELLELPDIGLTWLEMQPDLAPTTEPGGDLIDWAAFLNKYAAIPTEQAQAKEQLAAFSTENRDKFLDIFQAIDTSGDGALSKEEFISGIDMLNQQIKDDNQKISGADELFAVFDIDGDGEIDIEEFSKALQQSSALKGVTDALQDDQVERLKQNQDMIATTFKYLDTEKNGGIDRKQFQNGFDTLNDRMPARNKFGKSEEWFDMFNLNDSKQIDLNAFKEVFCAI